MKSSTSYSGIGLMIAVSNISMILEIAGECCLRFSLYYTLFNTSMGKMAELRYTQIVLGVNRYASC